MKKKEYQFLYPAIFVRDEEEGSYQAIFPDLNIYTDGKDLVETYLNAKDLLSAYFIYAVKYDTEFNAPSAVGKLLEKCKKDEMVLLVDAIVSKVEDN